MILFSFVHSHSFSLKSQPVVHLIGPMNLELGISNLTIRPQCSVGGQCSFKNENDASESLSL